jgi:hypothetical protein
MPLSCGGFPGLSSVASGGRAGRGTTDQGPEEVGRQSQFLVTAIRLAFERALGGFR